MFDIGWTEMLVVVCVAIIVVGPKDLPKMLRAFGRTMKSVRGLANDFQKQFEEAIKDTELDEVKKLASGKGFSPLEDIKKSATAYEKHVKAQIEGRAKTVDDDTKAEAGGLPEPASVKADTPSVPTPSPSAAQTSNPTLAEPAASKPVATKKATTGKSAAKKAEPAKAGSRQAPAKASAGPQSKSGAAKPAASKPATAKSSPAPAKKPATAKPSATKSAKPASKPATGESAKTA